MTARPPHPARGRRPGRHAALRDDAVPCAALVLAGGGGRRFGTDPKLLGDLDGIPVLEHVVRSAAAVPALERIVTVLGAHAQRLLAGVDLLHAEPVICADWRDGQSASLRCGLDALGAIRKVLVLLGDQPLVTPQAIARLATEPPGSRAAYDGVPGHPVVLGPQLVRQAHTLSGDRGLRELVRWRLVECSHLASGRDVDTPEDLEVIRREARAVV